MLRDLRFSFADGDRSCPPTTRGSRCRADPARTRLHPSAALRRSLTDWPSIRSARRPRSGRLADLPLVAEGINDPADAPAVLVTYRGLLGRAGRNSPLQHHVGILDHEQGPARSTTDRLRTEPPHARPSCGHPERRFANGQLRDDLVTLTHTAQHPSAERILVELNRLTSPLDPQLRLDARHREDSPRSLGR